LLGRTLLAVAAQAMSTMGGLLDSVYWLTWSLWEVGLAVASCLLLMCFGLMFQFDFFLRNGFFALFFLFFLFWVCMVRPPSLALSPNFLRPSPTATCHPIPTCLTEYLYIPRQYSAGSV